MKGEFRLLDGGHEETDGTVVNLSLTIEYDGTNYHGWQFQTNSVTIQGVLEDALERIINERPSIEASGRTDAGVHALGQVVSFRSRTRLVPAVIRRALNAVLPSDIVVLAAHRVPDDFHARYSALAKTYKYVILNRRMPSAFHRRFSWHIRAPLNTAAMEEGGRHLVGRHDFRSFWGRDTDSARDPVRTIKSLKVCRKGEFVEVWVKADGFLRYMVRNIAGTLVEMGRDRLPPARMKEILEAKDRTRAGPMAPPHGLFLAQVDYPEFREEGS